MEPQTLLFLLKPEERQILLALKKQSVRGFSPAVGKYNGVGGKVEAGETIEAAAVREAQEEIGVIVAESDLQKVAEISFSFTDHPEWKISGHIFVTERWQGEPTESDEMAPEWFAYEQIPYGKMWIDDQHWLPQVLAGQKIRASFTFAQGGKEIATQQVHVVPEL